MLKEVKSEICIDNKRQREHNTEMPERIKMSSFDGITPHVQRFKGSGRPTARSSLNIPFLSSFPTSTIMASNKMAELDNTLVAADKYVQSPINLFGGSFILNPSVVLPIDLTRGLDTKFSSNLLGSQLTRPIPLPASMSSFYDSTSKMYLPSPFFINKSSPLSTHLKPTYNMQNNRSLIAHEGFSNTASIEPCAQTIRNEKSTGHENQVSSSSHHHHHNRSPSPTDGK